ncbi:hypothetical protein CC1G_15460 [Coprinopsis cinerea okayama7|uniref:Uncharacterized protein n=1 Tax=Coprinopsis cinerea (strain Okayama-7 / 130 / ATCC MYA-4618 / FGSC 9003) TaxID=240176 RepID=D6RQQ2_COPC7|nr:hypothetical protein CC1G_15460 [Coprinopsis cinerea okayama7\|eukprot:XP_002910183.1 hypothetical protein CC1G_15460 [Coprinopsis cinerea okayama7\
MVLHCKFCSKKYPTQKQVKSHQWQCRNNPGRKKSIPGKRKWRGEQKTTPGLRDSGLPNDGLESDFEMEDLSDGDDSPRDASMRGSEPEDAGIEIAQADNVENSNLDDENFDFGDTRSAHSLSQAPFAAGASRGPTRIGADEPMAPAPGALISRAPSPAPELSSQTSDSSHSGGTNDGGYYTEPNCYKIFRYYPHGKPSYIPDQFVTLNDIADAPTFASSHRVPPPQPSSSASTTSDSTLFPNETTHMMMNCPNFNLDDARAIQVKTELRRIDKFRSGPASLIPAPDPWLEGSTTFRMAASVVKSALQEPAAERFHLFPYREFLLKHGTFPPTSPHQTDELFSELYTSPAFHDEHQKLVDSTPPGELEPVVIAIALYSDGTHLTSFGSATLWPIYLYIGNQSKYERAKPSSFSAHHLAYIPELDKTYEKAFFEAFGKLPIAEEMTHARREFIQAIWLFLLNPDFMVAYEHGVEWEFADGVVRRWFLGMVKGF